MLFISRKADPAQGSAFLFIAQMSFSVGVLSYSARMNLEKRPHRPVFLIKIPYLYSASGDKRLGHFLLDGFPVSITKLILVEIGNLHK
jgi:hypothetical protein